MTVDSFFVAKLQQKLAEASQNPKAFPGNRWTVSSDHLNLTPFLPTSIETYRMNYNITKRGETKKKIVNRAVTSY